MQIEIQARDFDLTHSLRNHIQRRLTHALSSRDQYIQNILVRLSDINGPRGGSDKCCHIQIMIPQQQDVVIEDTETDMYAAINCAISRASRTLGRRLTRQRDRTRNSYFHPKLESQGNTQVLEFSS